MRLTYDLPDEPQDVGADEDAIAHALQPLLENAIRHAHSSIRVTLARRDGQVEIVRAPARTFVRRRRHRGADVNRRPFRAVPAGTRVAPVGLTDGMAGPAVGALTLARVTLAEKPAARCPATSSPVGARGAQ